MSDPSWAFRILLDPGPAAASPVRVTVGTGARPGQVAEALAAMFDAEPALVRVDLEVGGRLLGSTTRTVLARLRERSQVGDRGGPTAEPGAGDGATLPGHSTGYVVLRFRCRSCDQRRRLLFVDDTPTCPHGHGPMEPDR